MTVLLFHVCASTLDVHVSATREAQKISAIALKRIIVLTKVPSLFLGFCFDPFVTDLDLHGPFIAFSD